MGKTGWAKKAYSPQKETYTECLNALEKVERGDKDRKGEGGLSDQEEDNGYDS